MDSISKQFSKNKCCCRTLFQSGLSALTCNHKTYATHTQNQAQRKKRERQRQSEREREGGNISSITTGTKQEKKPPTTTEKQQQQQQQLRVEILPSTGNAQPQQQQKHATLVGYLFYIYICICKYVCIIYIDVCEERARLSCRRQSVGHSCAGRTNRRRAEVRGV